PPLSTSPPIPSTTLFRSLDGETFDLVQHVDTVLAATSGHGLASRINPELMQSVLEIATPVCHTAADVEAELRKLRGFVCEFARRSEEHTSELQSRFDLVC